MRASRIPPVLFWLLVLVLAALVLAQGVPPKRTPQEEVTVKQVLLEREQADLARCKQDYAELWVEARKLSVAYQEMQQEVQRLKQEKPDAGSSNVEPRPAN